MITNTQGKIIDIFNMTPIEAWDIPKARAEYCLELHWCFGKLI